MKLLSELNTIMKKVLIGYGGFCREILADLGYKLKCFVDDEFHKEGETYKLSDFNADEYEALVVVGDPKLRKSIVDNLPKETKFWNYISKHAIIMDELKSIGVGNIICAGTIITTNVSIGNHVQLNLSTTIGHDTVISNYVTTAPDVSISGNVNIGDCVYLGTKSSVREKITICSNTTFGLNCGIVSNITEIGTYVGTPCKKIK